MQYWAGLTPAVFGLNVLSKGVRTGPIITHFGLACAQTVPHSPKFNHMSMAGRITVSKLWQTDIIKMIYETQSLLLATINESDQQQTLLYTE